MGTIKALCISEKKGTLKTPIHKALFQTEWGMVGDAHAGRWHRQVSFLGLAEIEEFRKRGIDVKLGAFGENIVADGFHFKELPIGTRLRAGEVWFEITQIGKECHKSCAIRSQVGDCIMPREGVFARVLHGGWIEEGDTLEIVQEKMPLDAAIVTASDKGSKGLREDKSGAKVQEMLEKAGYTVAEKVILPDEQHDLEHKMRSFGDRGIALVVTDGGHGLLGPRRHAGGDARRLRAPGSGHPRGDACALDAGDAPRHAEPRTGRHLQAHADRQPAGQQQGRRGVPRLCPAGAPARHRYPARRRQRMCAQVIG